MARSTIPQRAGSWLDRVKDRFRRHSAQVAVTRADGDRELLSDQPCRTPPVDILEGERGLVIVADVPGATRRSIEVVWDGGHRLAFHARGMAKSIAEMDTAWHRAFALPPAYDGRAATATVNNGVLRIEVPRHATFSPRAIPVRTSV